VNGEVWPISQTNAIGASCTKPQPSEFPILLRLNGGIIGPLPLLFRTIRPRCPVVRSVTRMCHPSLAAVTK
jgi:hypothetical protein